jgi:hypothetical protein
MTNLSDIETLVIPEPDNFDAKEVFTFFGLCSYYCQILEQGLVNLAVALRIGGHSNLTSLNIDASFEDKRKKTLGQLFNEISKYITISKKLENSLILAVSDRNYIAHSFFVVHDIGFCSENGRKKMIEELRKITFRVQSADNELEKTITNPLWQRFGITTEAIEKELLVMKAEAQAMDKIS